MRLDRLEISGFMRFRAPAVLDLRDLAPGVIAITGANGEGKSRLLDGALAGLYGPGAPNGAFPSREGTLATYATSRDAYIDTEWEIAGVGSFHARVSVDGERRASEAVLERIEADGRRRPLNENGLVTSFREAVAAVFPSRRQVLASAFAAQNRAGGFAALDQRGRVELFAELLDLHHLDALGATAKQCVDVAERGRLRLIVLRDELLREAGPTVLAAAETALATARRAHAAEAARAGALHAEVATRHATRETCAARAQESAVAVAEADALTAAIARDRQQFDDLTAQIAQLITDHEHTQTRLAADLQARRQEIRAQHTREAATHEAYRASHAQRHATAVALLAEAETIRAAAAVYAETTAVVTRARADEQRQIAALRAAQAELDAGRAAIGQAPARVLQLQQARDQVAVIATVPFGPRCAEAECQFLSMARTAQAVIPGLEVAVAQDAIDATTVTVLAQAVQTCETDLATVRAAIRAAEDRLAETRPAAMAISALDRAAATVTECAAALATATAALADLRAAAAAAEVQADLTHETRAAEAAAREAAAEAALTATLTATADRLVAAEMRLTDTRGVLAQSAAARHALDVAEVELNAAQRAYAEHQVALAYLDATQTDAATRVANLTATAARARAVGARLTAVEEECLAWSLIARALGRDGLPRLEIDAAGPTISQLVGDLLAVGYGARFAVDLTTQVERADKKGLKEEFAIRIFDNTYGGERDLADLSGGERVVVEEALRAGILLFHNTRQARPIQTCWRDETTGALDAENVPRYVAMLRRMHDLGGFRHTLFVTHSQAAAELADTVIRVAGGVPTIERAA